MTIHQFLVSNTLAGINDHIASRRHNPLDVRTVGLQLVFLSSMMQLLNDTTETPVLFLVLCLGSNALLSQYRYSDNPAQISRLKKLIHPSATKCYRRTETLVVYRVAIEVPNYNSYTTNRIIGIDEDICAVLVSLSLFSYF